MKIALSKLETMFAQMQENAPWPTAGPLKWEYFFTNHTITPLESLSEHLKSENFRNHAIYRSPDGSTYVLRVERCEKHTASTLHALNEQFEKLVAKHSVGSYDGMEVGPITE